MRYNILTITCFTLFSYFLTQTAWAQCDIPIDSTANACESAKFLCGLNLHKFKGTLPDTSSYDGPLPLCDNVMSQPDNIQWYRFFVCDQNVELLIKPTNCSVVLDSLGNQVSGMQAGIYRDCEFKELITCTTDGNIDTMLLASDSFIPGELVYLFVDGTFGSVCDYEIEVLSGIDTMLIDLMSSSNDDPMDGGVIGPDTVCVGSSGEYTFQVPTCVGSGQGTSCAYNSLSDYNLICYDWQIEPDSGYVFVGDSTGPVVTIVWDSIGSFVVDVTVNIDSSFASCGIAGIGDCGQFLPLEVEVVPPDYIYLPDIYLCDGESIEYCGQIYNYETVVECEIDSCLIEVQGIYIKDPLLSYQQYEMCEGECLEFMNQTLCGTGVYQVEDLQECGYHEIEIFEYYFTIELTVSNDINCEDDFAVIEAEIIGGGLSNYTLLWTDDFGNALASDQSLVVTEGGGYTLELIQNSSGCSYRESIYVLEDRHPLEAELNGSHISCIEDEATISYATSSQIEYLSWSGPNGFESSDQSIKAELPGVYSLSLIGFNKCTFYDEFVVEDKRVEPQVSLVQNNFVLDCVDDVILISLATDDQAYNYNWSSVDGNIVTNEDKTISVNAAGTYSVEVIDPSNECSKVLTIIVQDNPDMLLDFETKYPETICLEDAFNSLDVISVDGGRAPLKLYVNGVIQDQLSMKEISAGQYDLVLEDANGCSLSKSIEVKNAPPVEFLVVEEFDLVYDEEHLVSIDLNSDWNDIDNIAWYNQLDELIGSQSDLWLRITSNQKLKVVLTDIYGCVAEQQIDLRVKLLDNVYIPNVFTPNQDGLHDSFEFLTGPNPGSLIELDIYDRWGNNVYKERSVPLSKNLKGWDGTHNGEDMPSGVYAYTALIDIGNGEERAYSGSVTLLR